MRLHPAVKYAWSGSGSLWGDPALQLFGSIAGGFLTWYWGLKVPQEILDNPALGAVAAIVIGAVCGGAVIFLARLLWWPIHVKVDAAGGWANFIRANIGGVMWPIIAMILGVVAFVIMFGGGAIWFALESQKAASLLESQRHSSLVVEATAPIKDTTTNAGFNDANLSFEDRQYRVETRKFVLSDCLSLQSSFMEALNTPFTDMDQNQYQKLSKPYLRFVNGADVVRKWNELVQYVQGDMEKIDPAEQSAKLQSYLSSYKSLIVIGLIFEESAKDKNKFQAWRTADKQTNEAYKRLRNSTSKFLKEPAPDSYFIQII